MPDASIEFDMTDDFVTRAVRENCVGTLRESMNASGVFVLVASCGIAVLAAEQGFHWLFWLAGAPAAIAIFLLLGWLAGYAWWPRVAIRRISHLPHRRVKVALSDSSVAFETASERLEVTWDELVAVKRYPNSWLVRLRAGAEIPLPRIALTATAASYFDRRFP